MNANNSIKLFPETKTEALALAYVQSQDLSGKTPEDVAAMYADAYDKIKHKFAELRKLRNSL